MRTDGHTEERNGRRGPDQIRAEIAAARADLAATTHKLQIAVREKLDWKRYVLAHPIAIVGGCFALGFLLAYRRPRRAPALPLYRPMPRGEIRVRDLLQRIPRIRWGD